MEQETGNDEAAANEPLTPSPGTTTEQEKAGEKNGETYILVTSDVHCGIDTGFGYAGLRQIRDNLINEGYETILVDDGDSIQGRPVGTIFKGEKIIELMNDIGYDIAIPGNHEFDYGMERFLELSKMAEFPYISCNFNCKGDLVFDPYIIKEVSGQKIAFVGVTTPDTLRTSTPSYFKDSLGNYIYGFMQDSTGEALYAAVQEAVDDARAEGADKVIVMGHLGNEAECEPWTYADVIANTTGIDVLFDGHSHDTDKVVMTDKEGREVTRIAVGTALGSVGYCHITAEGEIDDIDKWNWNNKISAPELLDIRNDMREKVDTTNAELSKELDRVVATTKVDLTISDPVEKDSDGKPIRIIRRQETNLGDLVADAYRDQSGADIAFVNGGGIRTNIEKGDITYGDIISVHPFGNMLCVIEVSGQQILDALEWGSREVPGENGGFIQVSGLTYEIDTSVDNPCSQDENAMFTGISGKRRVKNVKVDGEPIDPSKKYTLAGHDYMLLSNGDGYTMFDGAPLLQDRVKLDNQVLIDYIIDRLNGEIGGEYSEPYGQGRITIEE
ncbi:MAG: bifunctional metallophosphatase/5'-nucleotidase [Lachnospiraceae bacterium]|nr:bifunctional metallophosphatase/5'-nucleotidase [Lachnospiraceae bacterium]